MKFSLVRFSLAFVSIVISACSVQKTEQNKKLSQFLGSEEQEQGLFSNRAQNVDNVIAIIKLKRPALLQSRKAAADGSYFVETSTRDLVIKEQENAIKELKKISEDIRVLYRYQMVLNGLAVIAPAGVAEKLKNLGTISYIENQGTFDRPKPVLSQKFVPQNLGAPSGTAFENNSVRFIGADLVHNQGITGRGIRVGVIDTGIDYTHSMLGGSGDPGQFETVNPDLPSELFPNSRVTGGIDLVGTAYNAAAPNPALRIPKPDENPIDEAGHGTHVAGTVAGIGDGINSYSGVAPDSELYAIKVFGKDGSTGDAVVVAALEYAADPNKDGKLSDQLQVVNLSLGGGFGSGRVLYGEAIKNLTEGGTIVVASAGNSGAVDYITGSPATSDTALSVAASVDNTDHNWKFRAVRFTLADQKSELVEAVEASFSKPISELTESLEGNLVPIGLAAQDLSDEQVAAVKGKVALIDRGMVNFTTKVLRAQNAGAIAAVIVNNQPGQPFGMGGDEKSEIPAIMISLDLGSRIKQQLTTGPASIQFVTNELVTKKDLIDTITDFSSKGPRIDDSVLKPEIAAPGSLVISADMGQGAKAVKLSGTSMAAPHMAGVMALLRQKFPSLSVDELKSLAMTTSTTLVKNSTGEIYPVTLQGAGRVQADKAVNAQILTSISSVSFGEISYLGAKVVPVKFNVKNISEKSLSLKIDSSFRPGLTLLNPQNIVIEKGESKEIRLQVKLNPDLKQNAIQELFGWITLFNEEGDLARIPVLAVVRATSGIQANSLKVLSQTEFGSSDSLSLVSLSNKAAFSGEAKLFNLLATDDRKASDKHESYLSRACDVQASGYRIVEKMDAGKMKKVLQVGVKMYEPLMSWASCEVSVLIDTDGDQIAEQELGLVSTSNLPGMAILQTPTASVLLNATLTRELRRTFEVGIGLGEEASEGYLQALVGFIPTKVMNHSTVAILEADVDLIARRPSGEVAIKVASILLEGSAREIDDFVGLQDQWKIISLDKKDHAFYDMPESTKVEAGLNAEVELVKGANLGELLVLYPQNLTVVSEVLNDGQMQILKPQFSLSK